MAKSFKNFRESGWDDDEWGSDDENRRKERKMENRRQARRSKHSKRAEAFAEDITTNKNDKYKK